MIIREVQDSLAQSMQLSQDSLQLNLQLNWLLSAEPRLPLGSCIQPKATCLPLGQQLNLALSVARLLQAGRVHDDPAHKLVHENSTELLQLLHLLASEGSTNSCNHSIQQTAQLAVQQHEQAILQQFRYYAANAILSGPTMCTTATVAIRTSMHGTAALPAHAFCCIGSVTLTLLWWPSSLHLPAWPP